MDAELKAQEASLAAERAHRKQQQQLKKQALEQDLTKQKELKAREEFLTWQAEAQRQWHQESFAKVMAEVRKAKDEAWQVATAEASAAAAAASEEGHEASSASVSAAASAALEDGHEAPSANASDVAAATSKDVEAWAAWVPHDDEWYKGWNDASWRGDGDWVWKEREGDEWSGQGHAAASSVAQQHLHRIPTLLSRKLLCVCERNGSDSGTALVLEEFVFSRSRRILSSRSGGDHGQDFWVLARVIFGILGGILGSAMRGTRVCL